MDNTSPATPNKSANENDAHADCQDCQWSATHDFMPPGPARLRVEGTCTMPTPGYKLTLKEAVPQGINPQILLLRLKTEAPTEIVPQVLTPTPVSFRLETDFDYKAVTILPLGVTIEIEKVS